MKTSRKPAGRLIVLEGIDGAGTTTQGKMLVRRLRRLGHSAEFTCEPTRGPLGREIRRVLHQERRRESRTLARWHNRLLPALFAADRLEHCRTLLEPRLAQGAWIICDRYYHSSYAYQGMDVPFEWIKSLNRFALKPHLTVILTVPEKIGRRRRLARGRGKPLPYFETTPQQRRIARNYARLKTVLHGERLVYLDGTQSIGQIQAQLLARLKTWL